MSTAATFHNPPCTPSAVRLRARRVVVLLVLVVVGLLAGGFFFLRAYAQPVVPKPEQTTTHPAWMRQAFAATPEEPPPAKPAAPPVDRSADILRELQTLQADQRAMREELKDLKKRPPTLVTPPPAQGPKVTTPPTPRRPAPMLFISHDKDGKAGTPVSASPLYTLAPGTTKLPCIIETAINSDVEGYFTAKVSTNVYDTATGRHLLVPQGSTILGNTQSSKLVYGNERMDTVSVTLTLPDGRAVDLGHAPVTDEQGIAGLTQRVNQHYGRLLAAVLIQGVLRGGATAISSAAAGAAGGQVITGVASTGSQAGNTVVGPLLSTRPTIEVDAGKLCNVLLLKELQLPAMWQDGQPQEPHAAKPSSLATRR